MMNDKRLRQFIEAVRTAIATARNVETLADPTWAIRLEEMFLRIREEERDLKELLSRQKGSSLNCEESV